VKNRTLALHSDRLGELTNDELSAVAAGAISLLPCLDLSALTPLIPTWDCTGCHVTC
jgi:hypothetical protein